jgi:hypothetical protein
MNEQQERALKAGLAALAATSRNLSASAHVETAVLETMSRHTAPSRRSLRWVPLAAALLLTSATGAWLAHRSQPLPPDTIEPSGFVALPGAGALPPLESGSIVRVSLPITTLPWYGIQIVPDLGRGPVTAELLIAQDGQPRAIRLVNDSD